jgi:hypothetical protein
MNRDFLGDAHDWMKGTIFRRLLDAKALRDFSADPMVTDEGPWSSVEYNLYATLLQVAPEQIIHHAETLRDNRRAYLEEIGHGGDLFLDPDIGVRTGRRTPLHNYIKPREVIDLAAQESGRIVAVYQHIRGQTRSDRLAVVQGAFTDPGYYLQAAVYGSASVALVFASFDASRVREVYKVFRDLLGPYAEKRVTLWECHGS